MANQRQRVARVPHAGLWKKMVRLIAIRVQRLAPAPASYQSLLPLTTRTTSSITGTSISTPTTAARARRRRARRWSASPASSRCGCSRPGRRPPPVPGWREHQQAQDEAEAGRPAGAGTQLAQGGVQIGTGLFGGHVDRPRGCARREKESGAGERSSGGVSRCVEPCVARSDRSVGGTRRCRHAYGHVSPGASSRCDRRSPAAKSTTSSGCAGAAGPASSRSPPG
jgi:hypothetical protein